MPLRTGALVAKPDLDSRRARMIDLIDDTPPTARNVLATALLGAREPTLPVAHLVEVGRLFGFSPGATRTCLWRMVSAGELTTDQATYTLSGSLLERRGQFDRASRIPHDQTAPWDDTWEIAVVALHRRGQMDRLGLRKAAIALRLAELKEGVWTRPNNLDPQRSPQQRSVVREQCIEFSDARTSLDADQIDHLFGLSTWSGNADRFIAAMDAEDAATDDEPGPALQLQFTLSVAVVRHLDQDPLLPRSLLPEGWPSEMLRTRYRAFDTEFQRRMVNAVG